MNTNPTTETETCGWLVEVASGNPEPDSYNDTVMIVPCGDEVAETVHQVGGVTVHLKDKRGLCAHHSYAMSLPEDEFERISDLHDGRAWS